MRSLATRWGAASRAQKAIAGVVALLVVIGAGVTIAGGGPAGILGPSPSPTPPPDTTAPTLAEVERVPSYLPWTAEALTYTFSSDEAGTIAYLGACTSDADRGRLRQQHDHASASCARSCTSAAPSRSPMPPAIPPNR